MNRKGFTLVELIGVIVILSLLALIIIPNVVTYLQKGISDSKEYQNESIILGAKNWASDHKDELPGDGEVSPFPIKIFQDSGYIDNDLKDPETGEAIDVNGTCVFITNNGKKYSYEVKSCS